MHPLLHRIAFHGTITAIVLALVGLILAEMAEFWTASMAVRPGSADLNFPVAQELRATMPMRLAAFGFAFIVVAEFSLYAFSRHKPVAVHTSPSPDDAEKLLNELLAQAEARMAATNTDTAAPTEAETHSVNDPPAVVGPAKSE